MALTPEELELLQLPEGFARQPDPLNDNLDNASRRQPDAVVEQLNIEQDTGLPAQVVEQDPEEAKRLQWLENLEPGTFRERSPKTAEWLAKDPRNAAVSKDDIPNLEQLEARLEAQKGWDAQTVGNIAKNWIVGLGKMPAQLELMLRADPDSNLKQLTRKEIELRKSKGDLEGANELEEMLAAEQQRVEELKDFLREASSLQADLMPKDMSVLEEGIVTGVTMGLDIAPGAALSIASKGRVNITLPYLTAKTGLESAASALEEGKDYETALAYGGIDAIIEAATERIPTRHLEKIFGEIGTDGMKSKLKSWLMKEAATEQVATAGQSLNAVLFEMDEELANAQSISEIAEIQGRRQLVTLIGTVVGGGGISATLTATDHLINRQNRARRKSMEQAWARASSEQAQVGLDQIFSLAQSSKTNERARQFYKDYVENTAPNQRIFISAEALEELPELPPDVAAQLDGSGADVDVSMSDFLEMVTQSPDALPILRPHVKSQSHLQTQAEMQADTDTGYIQALLKSAAENEQAKTEADAIFEQIKAQLVATGRQGELTARQSAVLLPAVVTTQYAELKARGLRNVDGSEISVKQLYEDLGFRIAGPAEAAPETEFVSQAPPEEAVQTITVDPPYMGRPKHEAVAAAATELEAVTAPSDNPRVRKFYNPAVGGEQDYALIEISETAKGLQLDSIVASRANAGNGRAGLAQVLKIADQQGLPVTVNPKAMKGYEGLTDQDLRDWFERNGFEKDGALMTRQPRPEIPGLLYDQAFGNIVISETGIDEFGRPVEITQLAQTVWENHQARLSTLQDLRGCASG